MSPPEVFPSHWHSEFEWRKLLSSAWQSVVPPPEKRTPHGVQNVNLYLTTLFLLILMAGLARRRGTWELRLAVLPFALAAVLRSSFGHVVQGVGEEPTNHTFGESKSISTHTV